jgi:2-amino-4-hydroxy-6-hydroxymethyldihydropteridine diphosphokinase
MRYYIGLGSNLGDKRKNLADAVRLLQRRGVHVTRLSSLYRTQPVDVLDQPWFLNRALRAESSLSPRRLLEMLRAIERELTRTPGRPKGPRRIDLDLLLAGPRIIRTRELVVPHPRLAERNFVLVPLAEIAPRAVHPVTRKTVGRLLRESRDRSVVFKVPPKERVGTAGVEAAARTRSRYGGARDGPGRRRRPQ